MTIITILENKDIFQTQCKTIVNPINCVGVMGKGIALEMKKRYEDMFVKYFEFCSHKMIDIGKLWLYKTDEKWILNFPTKKDWKDKSEYDYIELGMKKFFETYQEKGIETIAFPMLGCGNGGLDKNIVLEIMTKYLIKCKNLNIEIYF